MFVRLKDIRQTEAELKDTEEELSEATDENGISILTNVKTKLEKKLKKQKAQYKKFSKMF